MVLTLEQTLEKLLLDKSPSEKLEFFRQQVAKVQLEANGKGYGVDLERITILMESGIDTLQKYENA